MKILYQYAHYLMMLLCIFLSPFFSAPIDAACAIAPLAIAGIAAGVNALGAITGGLLGNRKRKKAYNEMVKTQEEAQARYEEGLMSEIRSNYLDRADSQAAIRRIIDYNNDVSRRQQTNAIKGGASDEARVALAAQQSRALGDTIGEIAGQGARYKAQLRDQMRQSRLQHDRQMAQFKYNLASDTSFIDAMTNAIGQSATLIGTAAMMGSDGNTGQGKSGSGSGSSDSGGGGTNNQSAEQVNKANIEKREQPMS